MKGPQAIAERLIAAPQAFPIADRRWGAEFTDRFARITLRSLLAPGNLPDLAAAHTVQWYKGQGTRAMSVAIDMDLSGCRGGRARRIIDADQIVLRDAGKRAHVRRNASTPDQRPRNDGEHSAKIAKA